jgi:hypothetical protein
VGLIQGAANPSSSATHQKSAPPRSARMAKPQTSAGTQRIDDEEHDRATDRHDPKEKHTKASIRSDGPFYMPVFWLFGTLGRAARKQPQPPGEVLRCDARHGPGGIMSPTRAACVNRCARK